MIETDKDLSKQYEEKMAKLEERLESIEKAFKNCIAGACISEEEMLNCDGNCYECWIRNINKEQQ